MKRSKLLFSSIISIILVVGLIYGVYHYTYQGENPIFLGTTTSIQNTGLLDYLIQIFEEQHDATVRYTAVGSGAAIQLARDGEVDAIITHAPEFENSLIDEGYSDEKFTLWFNYFVVIGPVSDPAGISSSTTIFETFEKLYNSGKSGDSTFYSRGDLSGTHLKELDIWEQIEYLPNAVEDEWYFETGTGMSSTLVTADNDDIGYTLSDLGTYVTLKNGQPQLQGQIIFDNDSFLFNPYSYMLINPSKTRTDLNTAGASLFLSFLQNPETDMLVRNYTVGNIVLFNPIEDL